MNTIDSFDWYIMDATADDCESIVQIEAHIAEYFGQVNRFQIATRLETLTGKGLMEEKRNLAFSSSHLLENPVEFWFSMTEEGRMLWESESKKYRDN